MKLKGMIFSFAVILISAAGVIFFAMREVPGAELDIRIVNNIVKTISDQWDEIQNGGELPFFDYEIDYVIIDNHGRLVAVTRRRLNENINDAIRNRDTIIDIETGGETVGKVILFNDAARTAKRNKANLIFISVGICIILIFISAVYNSYLYITIIRPFNRLQLFARRIAAGNLDIPLQMDKNNLFGAFTESFDLMREELKTAKQNERKADQSKKELVASLSHDIKTPVASIKAVTELMLFTERTGEDKEQLEIINAKAEQINSLITDMFHATLEELHSLRVTVAEVQSTAVPNLIKTADYMKRVKEFSIPNCIIKADLLRLQQVFDNIINNSYKYAGTDIKIKSCFDENNLVIEIIDFGAGVSEDELPLLCNKFYRGKDTSAKSGYGLGLYISKYFVNQMSGNLICKNHSGGFSVRLTFRLAN